MAAKKKEPAQKEQNISPVETRAPFRVLFFAALTALTALAVFCGWLIFRQLTLLDRESELGRQTVRLERELVDRRRDFEQQQETLEDQQTQLEAQQDQLEDQRAQLEEQRARLEAQRAQLEAQQDQLEAQRTQLEAQQVQLEAQRDQLDQARDTIDFLSHYPPDPPDGEVPGYTALFPDFYAPRWTGGTVTGGRVCCLTFDDGPSANTDRILEILDRYGIKATFFVVGSSAASTVNQERLRKIAAAGHTIGMHSWSHTYSKVYASVESFLTEFNQLYEWIYEVTGVHPAVFRFPGGSINAYNRGVYQEIIAEMTRRGFVYYDWNVSAGDATSTPRAASAITTDCLKGIGKNLAVVLAHDNAARTTTVEALPAVIEAYQEAGYTFSALHPDMKPVTFGYPKIQ